MHLSHCIIPFRKHALANFALGKVEEQITILQDALDMLKYKAWIYEVAFDAEE